jgi:AmmeMemoRadiSam system protein A
MKIRVAWMDPQAIDSSPSGVDEPSEDREGPTGGGREGLTDAERQTLRRIALESIEHGLDAGKALEPDTRGFPPALREPGAVFVTLNLRGRLRGCVGSFEARRPLALDVAQNAYSAAFMDFRFPPVTAKELPELDLHISLLAPLEPLDVVSREDLLAKLRPGVDGLLLEDHPHRSTFLPQVWETLPEPETFLGELFVKAGLSRDHWSKTVKFHRYAVEEF